MDVASEEIQRGAVERMTFFSDAVVAIAFTLLALELPVPEGATSEEFVHALAEESFVFMTFLIAFAVVGAHWMAHHLVFRYMVGIPPRLMTLNLCWLLLIVVTRSSPVWCTRAASTSPGSHSSRSRRR